MTYIWTELLIFLSTNASFLKSSLFCSSKEASSPPDLNPETINSIVLSRMSDLTLLVISFNAWLISFPVVISFPAIFNSSLKGPNSGLADNNKALSVVIPALRLEAINCNASGRIDSINLLFLSTFNINKV